MTKAIIILGLVVLLTVYTVMKVVRNFKDEDNNFKDEDGNFKEEDEDGNFKDDNEK